ncbi:hypothetical protein Peur_006147 [Populus x canadensis]|uniref:Uncharacterized protein n=1 Tax=Populus trichocarpa TaxID=3694 RepID=A0A3N7FD64_POPTR
MLHNLKHYGVTLGVFSSFVVSKAARGFLSTMALLWENEQIDSVARASIEAEHDPTY